MKKILVVDDHANVIRATLRALASHYEVLGASTGEEALLITKTLKPDLVLLDWRLQSRVSGKEVLISLKEDYPKIPVFVVTGSLDSKTEIESLGADLFLLKPVENLKEIVLKTFPPC